MVLVAEKSTRVWSNFRLRLSFELPEPAFLTKDLRITVLLLLPSPVSNKSLCLNFAKFSFFADWLPPSSLQSLCNRKIQVISRCYTAMQSRCKDRWIENNNFELSLYQYKTVEYIMSKICQKLPLFKCHIVDTINENFISCL